MNQALHCIAEPRGYPRAGIRLSKPAKMNTSDKVHTAVRDPTLHRTSSGGVRNPSDDSHYPALGSASADASLHRLSRLSTSFKDRLTAEQPAALRTGEASTEGDSSSKVATEPSKDTKLAPLGSPGRSPRIAAERQLQSAASEKAEEDAMVEALTSMQQVNRAVPRVQLAEQWRPILPAKCQPLWLSCMKCFALFMAGRSTISL